jgi:hypothetical protein
LLPRRCVSERVDKFAAWRGGSGSRARRARRLRVAHTYYRVACVRISRRF